MRFVDDLSNGVLAIGAFAGFAAGMMAVATHSFTLTLVGAVAFGVCVGTLCRRAGGA